MDKSWKAWERRVAALLGGVRRGADTRSRNGAGKTDVIHDELAIECKLLGRPGFADCLSAAKQAETNAESGLPIAVVQRKGRRWQDALVVMRLETFVEARNVEARNELQKG